MLTYHRWNPRTWESNSRRSGINYRAVRRLNCPSGEPASCSCSDRSCWFDVDSPCNSASLWSMQFLQSTRRLLCSSQARERDKRCWISLPGEKVFALAASNVVDWQWEDGRVPAKSRKEVPDLDNALLKMAKLHVRKVGAHFSTFGSWFRSLLYCIYRKSFHPLIVRKLSPRKPVPEAPTFYHSWALLINLLIYNAEISIYNRRFLDFFLKRFYIRISYYTEISLYIINYKNFERNSL